MCLTGRLLLTGMAALLLTACSNDSEVTEQGNRLQMATCFTRALSATPHEGLAIELYMGFGTEARKGAFIYREATGQWDNSNVRAKQDERYHIYGFMPAQADHPTAISPLDGDYSYGASLTVAGLSPVMTESPCFIAGVKAGTDVHSAADITEWSYLYVGREEGENQVNLLMDYLYAGVSLRLYIGQEYATIRSIKLKRIQLRPSTTDKVRISITQQPGQQPLFGYETVAEAAYIPDLLNSVEGVELSTTTPLTVEGYVAPSLSGLTLISTYDIYDKQGHCIRKDETAENNLSAVVTFRQGTKTNLSMAVRPSYLNVLGDPDGQLEWKIGD